MTHDERSNAYRQANLWERQLQNAIRERHRYPRSKPVKRRMYRKWLRHCRTQADLFEAEAARKGGAG